jgi:hypothetical protein
MKKSPSYTGNVIIKMTGQFAGACIPDTITPTDTWKQYELELKTNYVGQEGVWRLDFVAQNSGDLYFDNIQFMEKGNYTPGSSYAARTVDLLKEFNPASLRFGGIDANGESLKYTSGKGSETSFSYADWLNMANILNSKAYISIGVGAKTDFVTDPTNTFKTFVEYMAGDASTTIGGAIRQSEGYGNLMANSKGLMIDFGNEVWGQTAHGAPIGIDYNAYGAWARNAANIIKATAGYDPTKMLTSYSGRYPGQNYGLHQSLLTGDKGEVDYLSISGYMGGNMDLDPKIPLGKSQLDYHKNSIMTMQTNLHGLKNDWKEMLMYAGRILGMYMYEGNMTQPSYNGRLGQAITFADYYSSVPLYGVPFVSVFQLTNGPWRIIDDQIGYKKLPLFHVGKYINKYCKGIMLDTKFTSDYKIYDSSNTTLTIDPVGCKAYADSANYSIALFSRDFENDYVVQVDIPDTIGNGATCKMITIHGDSYASTDVVIDEKVIANFADSILVTVPKYGMVILSFEGKDQNYKDIPYIYTPYKQVESVKVFVNQTPDTPLITKKGSSLKLGVTVLPTDAFLNTVDWKIIDNDATGAYLRGTSNKYITASDTFVGAGTVSVVVTAFDKSHKSDTLQVVFNIPTAVEEIGNEKIEIYPVPAQDYLNVKFPENVSGSLSIVDLNGKQLFVQEISGSESKINVSKYPKGVYLLKMDLNIGYKKVKFIKL